MWLALHGRSHAINAADGVLPTAEPLARRVLHYSRKTDRKLRERARHFEAGLVVEWFRVDVERWWIRQRDGNVLVAFVAPGGKRGLAAVTPIDDRDRTGELVTAYEPVHRRDFEAIWRWRGAEDLVRELRRIRADG